MIPAALLSWVTGKVGERFAKPLIYAAAALLIILAVWGWFKWHDSRVISAHDAKGQAATAVADKQADDHAGDQRTTDAVREQSESTQTTEAINAAHRNGTDPRAAYYDCVRKQQSARRAGQPSPSC